MTNNWRQIVADWKGESVFSATNPSGGSIQIGSREGMPGIGPMELVLAALAGCTGMDIISILSKKRQDVTDLKLVVRGKRAAENPKVYTEIQVTYVVWGNHLNRGDVENAIKLSEEKYCSVGIMLQASVPVTWSFQILAPGEEYIAGEQEITR